MNNENINFDVIGMRSSRNSDRDVLIIEPSISAHIENYHYDIRMFQKDFDVQEIDDDLHFIYVDEIRGFFQKHGESNISDVPVRLMILNESLF